jgi:hypothetical protein
MGSVLLALDHATCGGDMLQAAISLDLAHTLLPQPVATAAALIRAAVQQRPDLLLINRDSELLSVTSIEAMVEQLDCPIVLV